MTGPRVLAVDFSLTCTGFAAHAPDLLYAPRAWTFNTKRYLDGATGKTRKLVGRERRQAIIAEMADAVGEVRPDVILLEKLYVPVQISEGWIDLCKTYGVVAYFLEGRAPLLPGQGQVEEPVAQRRRQAGRDAGRRTALRPPGPGPRRQRGRRVRRSGAGLPALRIPAVHIGQ